MKTKQNNIKCFRFHYILAAIMLLGMLAVVLFTFVVSAANSHVPVEGITVSDANGKSSMSNGTITVSVAGSSSGCGSSATETVTIKNTSGKVAVITFNWQATNVNSWTLNGSTMTGASGSYGEGVSLDPDGSITIVITTGKNSTANKLVLSNFNISFVADSFNATFEFDDTKGAVTVDGASVSSGESMEVASAGVALVATAKSGNTFLGWIDSADGRLLSNTASYTYKAVSETSVKAVFVTTTSDTAWFLVDNSYLTDDLTKAGTLGSTIVLMNNGTLSGKYTIASGDTLLVPYDAANTLCTTEPKYDDGSGNAFDYGKPSAFRTLTMAEGAEITVNGAISVSAKVCAYQRDNACPVSKVGFIKMNSESNITVNNGGKLYAWGFIIGSGSVTAKSGATVYECFQLTDWRGGDTTSGMVDNTQRVFPMSQYYVQNVEVPLTLEAGAVENAFFCVYVSVVGVQKSTISFIGKEGTACMFPVTSGSITKDYDENTDRLVIDIDGEVAVSSFQVSIKASIIGTVKLDTNNYNLPLNNNITVNVNSGSKVTVNQDLAMLPGTQLNIDEGATVTLASGKKLFVYDSDQWGGYCYTSANTFVVLQGVPDRKYTRTNNDLIDAKILVNGTLDASAGYIYTTANGANICSEGSGVIKNQHGTDTITYQFYRLGDTEEYREIPVTVPQLCNPGATYVPSTLFASGSEIKAMENGYWLYVSHIKEASEEGEGSLIYFKEGDDVRVAGIDGNGNAVSVVGCSNVPASATLADHGILFLYHSETGNCTIDNDYNIKCLVCGNTAKFITTDETTYSVQFGYFTGANYYIIVKNENGNYYLFDNKSVSNNQISLESTADVLLNSEVQFICDDAEGDIHLRGYQKYGTGIRFFASISPDILNDEGFEKIKISMTITDEEGVVRGPLSTTVSTVYEYLYNGNGGLYQFMDSYVFSVKTDLAFFNSNSSISMLLRYDLLDANGAEVGTASEYTVTINFADGVISSVTADAPESGADQGEIVVTETEDTSTAQ